MSACIQVLQPGYSKWIESSKHMLANGTSTLVRANGLNILVDTLGPWDANVLTAKLSNCGLHTEDIDILIGTHGHPDHIGNLNLFLKSKHYIGFSIYQNDCYEAHPYKDDVPLKLCENVEIRPTPGHTLDSISVVINNAVDLGSVVIAGDLFENKDDIYDDSIWKDAGSDNEDLQILHRNKIIQIADYIIPGHGDLFSVKSINKII